MGAFTNFISAMAEAAVELSENTYTQAEKDEITKVRDIMRKHGQTRAAEALDEVISNFYKGMTYPTSSRPTTGYGVRIMTSGYTPTEWSYKIKSEFDKIFKIDTSSGCYCINSSVYGKLMVNGDEVVIALSTNPFIMSPTKSSGRITLKDGHVTNVENNALRVYKDDMQNAIDKIVSIVME